MRITASLKTGAVGPAEDEAAKLVVDQTNKEEYEVISGIGVDIVAVAAVASSINQYGKSYLERLLTATEIQYCGAVPISAQRYAARIAVKEAVMKALSTGWGNGVGWLDFEVLNESSGQPVLLVHGTASQLIKDRGVSKIWVSISHISEYAIAQVI